MMGWYDNGWGWGAGIGMIVMVLFWGGLIALVVWAVARMTRGDVQSRPSDSPRQILDRRLASGEIDAEQYAQTRHLLESRSTVDETPPA